MFSIRGVEGIYFGIYFTLIILVIISPDVDLVTEFVFLSASLLKYCFVFLHSHPSNRIIKKKFVCFCCLFVCHEWFMCFTREANKIIQFPNVRMTRVVRVLTLITYTELNYLNFEMFVCRGWFLHWNSHSEQMLKCSYVAVDICVRQINLFIFELTKDFFTRLRFYILLFLG